MLHSRSRDLQGHPCPVTDWTEGRKAGKAHSEKLPGSVSPGLGSGCGAGFTAHLIQVWPLPPFRALIPRNHLTNFIRTELPTNFIPLMPGSPPAVTGVFTCLHPHQSPKGKNARPWRHKDRHTEHSQQGQMTTRGSREGGAGGLGEKPDFSYIRNLPSKRASTIQDIFG